MLSTFAGTQFDGNVVNALAHWSQSAEGQAALTLTQKHRDVRQDQSTSRGAGSPDSETLCHIFSFLYQLESLCDGFYLLDSELRFVLWSAGIGRLLGHRAGDMLQRTRSADLFLPELHARTAELDPEGTLQRVLKTGQAASSRQSLKSADGILRELETQTVPLFDARGRLQGIAEMFRDVNHQRGKLPGTNEALKSPSLDPLTQVLHRGELDAELAQLTARAKRNLTPPFSVIFMDLDHFKQINDVLGHVVGDKALVEVSRLLRYELYSGESIGHCGGEEFLIICPETPVDLAVAKAERVRNALTRLRIEELLPNHLTASFGVAEWNSADDVETLTKRADDALYRAKRDGRNRTRSLRIQRGKAVTDSQFQMPVTDPCTFSAKFLACMTANLTVFKLRSYVEEYKGTVVSVEPRRAVIRLGRRGLLSFWQSAETNMPIEVTFEFGDEAPHNAPVHAQRRNHAQIAVSIRPAGSEKSSETFQVRAKKVFREICSYFVGEVQEAH